jgi:hypothetical protein
VTGDHGDVDVGGIRGDPPAEDEKGMTYGTDCQATVLGYSLNAPDNAAALHDG